MWEQQGGRVVKGVGVRKEEERESVKEERFEFSYRGKHLSKVMWALYSMKNFCIFNKIFIQSKLAITYSKQNLDLVQVRPRQVSSELLTHDGILLSIRTVFAQTILVYFWTRIA